MAVNSNFLKSLIFKSKLLFNWLGIIIFKPRLVKFFMPWLRSLSKNGEAGDQPWIVYEAREWLDAILDQGMKIFEWGSGGSTLYFASRVKEIISVEHDSGWFNKVNLRLKEQKVANCRYFLLAPTSGDKSLMLDGKLVEYKSSVGAFKDYNFFEYCRAIENYPEEYFDIVLVDGRARPACIAHASRKIKRGGYLILDNSERSHYQAAHEWLEGWPRADYYGPGPYGKTFWQTSIFKRIS